MKGTVVAFGASNSKSSINRQFASYAGSKLVDFETRLLDLNDFEMPIFSVDRERKDGIPRQAIAFKEAIEGAEGLIISFAEHNGTYSTAFKNIYDWISRIKGSIWADKPTLALATSPGRRGGSSVLEHALSNLPRRGAQIVGHFSLPSFKDNYSPGDGITNIQLGEQFDELLNLFEGVLIEKNSPTGSDLS